MRPIEIHANETKVLDLEWDSTKMSESHSQWVRVGSPSSLVHFHCFINVIYVKKRTCRPIPFIYQGSTLAVARWPGATRNWCRATKLWKKLHFGGAIGQLKFQSDDVMRITLNRDKLYLIHFRRWSEDKHPTFILASYLQRQTTIYFWLYPATKFPIRATKNW